MSADSYQRFLQPPNDSFFLFGPRGVGKSTRPKAKVREKSHAKFYWFDSGVARAAAGLTDEHVEREWLGRSLETLIFHELRCYHDKLNVAREFFIIAPLVVSKLISSFSSARRLSPERLPSFYLKPNFRRLGTLDGKRQCAIFATFDGLSDRAQGIPA